LHPLTILRLFRDQAVNSSLVTMSHSGAVDAEKNPSFATQNSYLKQFFLYNGTMYHADSEQGKEVIEQLRVAKNDPKFIPAKLPVRSAIGHMQKQMSQTLQLSASHTKASAVRLTDVLQEEVEKRNLMPEDATPEKPNGEKTTAQKPSAAKTVKKRSAKETTADKDAATALQDGDQPTGSAPSRPVGTPNKRAASPKSSSTRKRQKNKGEKASGEAPASTVLPTKSSNKRTATFKSAPIVVDSDADADVPSPSALKRKRKETSPRSKKVKKKSKSSKPQEESEDDKEPTPIEIESDSDDEPLIHRTKRRGPVSTGLQPPVTEEARAVPLIKPRNGPSRNAYTISAILHPNRAFYDALDSTEKGKLTKEINVQRAKAKLHKLSNKSWQDFFTVQEEIAEKELEAKVEKLKKQAAAMFEAGAFDDDSHEGLEALIRDPDLDQETTFLARRRSAPSGLDDASFSSEQSSPAFDRKRTRLHYPPDREGSTLPDLLRGTRRASSPLLADTPTGPMGASNLANPAPPYGALASNPPTGGLAQPFQFNLPHGHRDDDLYDNPPPRSAISPYELYSTSTGLANPADDADGATVGTTLFPLLPAHSPPSTSSGNPSLSSGPTFQVLTASSRGVGPFAHLPSRQTDSSTPSSTALGSSATATVDNNNGGRRAHRARGEANAATTRIGALAQRMRDSALHRGGHGDILGGTVDGSTQGETEQQEPDENANKWGNDEV
jgi:hypothetical protein